MSLIFHPLLALIASVTDRELARYVEFLKEENKILRSRVPGQIHTKPPRFRRAMTSCEYPSDSLLTRELPGL